MKIAVLGYGTVGRGVCEMIRASKDFELGYVLERPEKVTESFMTDNLSLITSDSSTEAVVECMGGVEPAFSFLSSCLKAGKHIVTSNKALVAAKGLELQALAQEKGCIFLFSAACGGAIPVLHNLSIARETDEIFSVCGILNGTTNFILTKMASDGLSYSEALSMAQKLGYAEADPTADVSGMDTMRKVMLSSAVVFDKLPDRGYCVEGIENVVSNLPKGYCLRLLGSCGLNQDGSVYALVQPTLVREGDLFGSVTANRNMATYEGKYCGPMSLGGQGAGSLPTASAVLRDLSGVLAGAKSMLKSSCVRCEADNSKAVFDYYVVEDGAVSEVSCDALSMKNRAEMARKAGKQFFFAAYKERKNA